MCAGRHIHSRLTDSALVRPSSKLTTCTNRLRPDPGGEDIIHKHEWNNLHRIQVRVFSRWFRRTRKPAMIRYLRGLRSLDSTRLRSLDSKWPTWFKRKWFQCVHRCDWGQACMPSCERRAILRRKNTGHQVTIDRKHLHQLGVWFKKAAGCAE